MDDVTDMVARYRERAKRRLLDIEPASKKRPYMIADAYFDRIRKDERLWK